MKGKLPKVSKRKPCPVCGRPDWCGVSVDGLFAVCMRIKSDHPTKNNGWLHKLDGAPLKQTEIEPTHIIHDRAKPDHLDAIYSTLIRGQLVLSKQHKDSLLARGLDGEAIERGGYRSTPGVLFSRNVARALAGYDLTGIPGFYRTNNQWLMANSGEGIMIPVRDSQTRIRGFQIRRDEQKPKYIWLSSAKYPEGSSSGAPIHFSHAHLIRQQGKAIITEGSLKADIIAHKLNVGVIGIPGVTNFPPDFAVNLKRRFPELAETVIAFDADFQTNDQVARSLFNLINQLRFAGHTVRVWTWGAAKGLDDLLAA